MVLLKAMLVLAGLHMMSAAGRLNVDIASHLKHLGTHRYPNEAQKGAREQAAEYIAKQFEECGLRVDLQSLKGFAAPKPGDQLNYIPYKQDKSQVQGTNIIGLSGPVRDEAGAVVVVGANYDTDGVGSPLWDNGAGVAVLLETARLYQAAVVTPRLATLFVAFDLSTDRYGGKASSDGSDGGGGGGGGLPGAYSLVQDYLRSFVSQNTSTVGGAIVLGPLMNVNHETGSQGFDSRLTKVGGRLVEFRLGNHSHTLLPPSLHAREAAYFWQSTFKGLKSPLPAILLTDTETNRAWPRDAATRTQLTEAQREFLDTTVASLVRFLVQRQPVESVEEWREVGLLTALMVSCGVNLLLLVHLHHLCSSPNAGRRHGDAHSPSETLSLQDMKCTASDDKSSFTVLS
ncbi:uncharacterized protein LOC135091812 isoform X2 [Scylla paramamosain]|uniref:uncharacterized protein LOC135091812 isoform X2 n=1 Tax=Scylla paramamosain TaxID=85552 RepID=UPI0030830D42